MIKIKSLIAPVVAGVVILVVALVLAPHRSSMEQMMKNANGGTQVSAAKQVTVKIHNYAFVAQNLTVHVGTKVTWTNMDATAHTATANNNTSFDTGTINPGQSKTITFKKAGTYPYHCAFHAFMTGTVTVVQ